MLELPPAEIAAICRDVCNPADASAGYASPVKRALCQARRLGDEHLQTATELALLVFCLSEAATNFFTEGRVLSNPTALYAHRAAWRTQEVQQALMADEVYRILGQRDVRVIKGDLTAGWAQWPVVDDRIPRPEEDHPYREIFYIRGVPGGAIAHDLTDADDLRWRALTFDTVDGEKTVVDRGSFERVEARLRVEATRANGGAF